MNVNIHIDSPATDSDSVALGQLADILEQDYDLPVQIIREESTNGVKCISLAVALSIISTSLSAIGTLISALNYWKSRQPNYSVTFKLGNITFTLDNISQKKLQDMISKLDDNLSATCIKVKISAK